MCSAPCLLVWRVQVQNSALVPGRPEGELAAASWGFLLTSESTGTERVPSHQSWHCPIPVRWGSDL